MWGWALVQGVEQGHRVHRSHVLEVKMGAYVVDHVFAVASHLGVGHLALGRVH